MALVLTRVNCINIVAPIRCMSLVSILNTCNFWLLVKIVHI